MGKKFNTTGPCMPGKHYMIPSQNRCKGATDLIDDEQYFVIHAARQSGKTTLLMELLNQLNSSREYYALYCSLESLQEIEDMREGIPAIVRTLSSNIKFNPLLKRFPFAKEADFNDFNNVLKDSLISFCMELDKPLVLFFDEIDCLSNGTLIAFLRQLRDGYTNRAIYSFVHSIALVGMRNIRDYKAKVREDSQTLGSASPFNIAKKTFTLSNFSLEEITALYSQHKMETGQVFPDDVIARIYHYTQGQPWLVNAAAAEIVEEIFESDYAATISVEHVEQAVKTIMLRRDAHIDSLLQRLKEKRVQKVVEPVLLGKEQGFKYTDDDFQYVLDLGLMKVVNGSVVPSNPIYGEMIVRALNFEVQMTMDASDHPPYAPAYMKDGALDMKKLLTDFQRFWRMNSEIWIERYQYKEAAPHLVLMAFLQRILNARGTLSRELATGPKRLDLCAHHGDRDYPIELKRRRRGGTYKEGLDQLAGYMDKLGRDEGWLIVFDQREDIPWDKKIFWKTTQIDRKCIHTIGC